MVTTKTTNAPTTTTATTTSSSSSSSSLSPSPSSSTMAAPAAPAAPATPAALQRKKPGPKPKADKPSLIVKLKLSSELLGSLIKPALTEPVTAVATPTGSEPSPQPEAAAVEALTPGVKRKGVPGPKPGVKRSRTSGVAPAKPGRKKAKLDPSAPALLAAGSKLGPKANTGAINDKLRALDRSGKPCKRWTKAGFQIKSFTGIQWTVPTWAAPRHQQMQMMLDENVSAAASVEENASVTTEQSPGEDKVMMDAPPAPAPESVDVPAPAPVIPTMQMSPAGIAV